LHAEGPPEEPSSLSTKAKDVVAEDSESADEDAVEEGGDVDKDEAGGRDVEGHFGKSNHNKNKWDNEAGDAK